MKNIFLSFADSRYGGSKRRIKKQAKQMQVYDEIIIADERDLDDSFCKKFKDQLILGSRGYGFWSWKPQMILQVLRKCDTGDIIQYTDAGCHLNPEGRSRLLEYFEIVKDSSKGIGAFSFDRQKVPAFFLDQYLFDYPNRNWIKGDLLDYFNLRDDTAFLDAQQVWAGVVFVQKNEKSISFIKEWLAVIEHDFCLIDDTPSLSPNLPGFIEHRHDQAIFSILCRKHDIQCLSAYEQNLRLKETLQLDLNVLKRFPIHAHRDKDIGLKNRIINRFSRLLKI